MRLLRSFQLLAFVLVFLSIVGLALAQQSVGLLLVAGALTAISWYVTEGPRGRTLPKWVSNILIIAVALHTFVELFQGPHDTHLVLGRFGLWLTLIKLYERRTARDHAHLLMLSFLLMLVASLTAIDLLFGVVLLAYIALGVYVLLLFQLHASHEQARHERQATTPTEYRLLPPLKPIIGKHVAMNFRVLVTAIGLAGVLLGTVAFIAFPRGVLQDAFRAINIDRDRLRTGFADGIDLNRGGRITESRRPVMAVQLLNLQGEPFEAFMPLRLRGAVLNHYEGNGKWGITPGIAPQPMSVGSSAFRLVTALDTAPSHQFTQVARLYQNTNVLFSMHAPIAVSTSRDVTATYNPRWQTLRIASGARSVSVYQVRVNPVPPIDLLEVLSDTEPIGLLGGLARLRDDRIEEMATNVLSDAGFDLVRPDHGNDPEGYWRWAREAAHHLTRYFHSPAFHYTLDVGFAIPLVDGQRMDPVQFFLLKAKRGHCEYFASALVAMCTNLGIESRLVTGYLAGEYDAAAQEYEVLERNAHAWVEVRTSDVHWTPFDPTPPAALSEIIGAPVSLGERLLWMYDRAAAAWSRNFIDFDSSAQERMTDRLNADAWTERARDAMQQFQNWLFAVNRAFYFGPAGYIYIGFVSMIVASALIVFVMRLRRAAAIRRAARLGYLRRNRDYFRIMRDSGFYLDMLETLARSGAAKPAWMPPMAFADQLAQSHPAAGELVRDLSRLFYHVRYGMNRLSDDEVHTAREKVAKLAVEMGRK